MSGKELQWGDPEPPIGTRVADMDNVLWERYEGHWASSRGVATWVGVVSAYGPVTVERWGYR